MFAEWLMLTFYGTVIYLWARWMWFTDRGNIAERLFKWLLDKFGYRLEFYCEWGVWDSCYDSVDFMMHRPIHKGMSVAPPWAKMRIVKV